MRKKQKRPLGATEKNMNFLLLEKFRVYSLMMINILSTKQTLKENLKEHIHICIFLEPSGPPIAWVCAKGWKEEGT